MTQFLSNRAQHVISDGYQSKLVNFVTGVPHGGVLGPLLFLLYTSGFFFILKNKLIGYENDSTLLSVVPFPDVRVTVAESLDRDLTVFHRGMKLNESKTKTMIVSMPRTMYP